MQKLQALLPVELVHDTVCHRRNDEARHDQKYQACIECIQAREHLAPIRLGSVYRPHSAQKHCSIQECIAPWELLEVLVARHTEHE